MLLALCRTMTPRFEGSSRRHDRSVAMPAIAHIAVDTPLGKSCCIEALQELANCLALTSAVHLMGIRGCNLL